MMIRPTLPGIAVFALLASFDCFATETFNVSAELMHGGKSFGSPSAVVKAGTPATLGVSGPAGYTLSLTVTELAPDSIQVSANLDSPHGAIAPVMVVRPGQRAAVSVGTLGMALIVQPIDG